MRKRVRRLVEKVEPSPGRRGRGHVGPVWTRQDRLVELCSQPPLQIHYRVNGIVPVPSTQAHVDQTWRERPGFSRGGRLAGRVVSR